MTKFWVATDAQPFSSTRVLATLATAVEMHLTARDAAAKMHAWRHLEAKLAEAKELLSIVA